MRDNKLVSFSVNGCSVSYDGQTAVVMLDYTIKTREGQTIEDTNVPVMLVREKDIWKLSYHVADGRYCSMNKSCRKKKNYCSSGRQYACCWADAVSSKRMIATGGEAVAVSELDL